MLRKGRISGQLDYHAGESNTCVDMMQKWISLGIAFAFVLTSFISHASHVAGADITWECLGGNQFEITLSVYTDCDGIPPSTISESITIENTCGLPVQNLTLNYVTPTVGTTPDGGINIAQLCPADSLNSTCFGGTLPGMQMTQYTAIVTLPNACNYYTVSWDICCRNAAITNLQNPGTASTYVEANIYTGNDPCDNSPIFTSQPIPYVCVNQPVSYNYGAVDPDGDSLVYSLIPAREDFITLIPYQAGYTSASPIPGITIDPNTGALSFTPTLTGNFVIVVLIQEYDPATGLLVGEIMRDMQFTVIPCANINPTLPTSGVANVSGTASQTGPFAFDMCVGTNISFDIEFTDVDAGDTLTVTSNATTLLAGATFTTSGVNPVTASVSWTAVGNTASVLPITFNVSDNSCPIAGIATQTVVISIIPSVYAGQDLTICDGSPVNLSASGGSTFLWEVVSGPPMIVGTNFSCDTCSNPIANPASTTTYLVTSNLNALCNNIDTIEVTVTPPFDFSAVTANDVTCNGDGDGSIVLGAPSGSAPSPYAWELFDAGGMRLDTVSTGAGHSFVGLAPGTYSVKLTEANGCEKDTTGLVINEPDPMSIITGDTTICLTTSGVVSATASGGNGGYTYTWSGGLTGNGPHTVGPMTSTDYAVFATDVLGCVSPTDSFTVNLYPALSLNPVWMDSICIDAPATLTGGGSGGIGAPYTYTWSQVGVGSLGASPSITTTPSTGNTDFVVTMSDACGTPTVTDTLNVGWYAPPRPLIGADRFEDCFPASITFFNNTNAADVGSTCVWDFGDGNVVSGGCTSINHTFANVGCYDVGLTVFSPEGCPGDTTYSQLVCARPYPQAQFSFGPQPTNVFNPTISFFNESIDGVSYKWFFGENGSLGTSEAVDPVWTFPDFDSGTYPVWLYTTNEFGCVDSIMYLVVIDGEFQFWVPNTFTPDGDNLNDFFGPSGEGISADGYLLQIFNRWGELIYQTNDPFQPWDGNSVMQGVYAYRIEAVNKYTGIKNEYMGHVTLLR